MQLIHAREYLGSDQFVRVECNAQCNVQLIDDPNFQRYRRGESYRYFGGFFKEFPAVLVPPCAGYWNVTIDVGGASASIRYDIGVRTFSG